MHPHLVIPGPQPFPKNTYNRILGIVSNLSLLPNPMDMLGSGAKRFKHIPLPSYHHHHHHRHHHGRQVFNKDAHVPKGCLAIKVGQGEEEQQRIMVPVNYLNHPLFAQLLKEAEEEYGFHQQGTISIPCQFEEFMSIQDLIHRDNRSLQNHHHHLLAACFRA